MASLRIIITVDFDARITKSTSLPYSLWPGSNPVGPCLRLQRAIPGRPRDVLEHHRAVQDPAIRKVMMSTMVWNFKFQFNSLDNTTTTAAESRWPEESWTRWCLPPISTHQPFVYWDNWLLSHFGRSYYQKWFLKNSCSLLPGDWGSKFWPRNVAGGGRWSEGRIFYSAFPRSQVGIPWYSSSA